MNDDWKTTLAARVLRWCLWPVWLRSWHQRRRLRRNNPTAIIHPHAVVEGTDLGRSVFLDEGVWIYQCKIGDYSYVVDGARVAHTKMGRFCSVAPRAYVGLPQHPARTFVSSHPIFYQYLPSRGQDFAGRDYFSGFSLTEVGHDVWIGAGAMVKGGIKIGHGAIIGAGAVVTHDVPAFAICAGVPARVIRYRFSPRQIEFLLSFEWWNKDEKWLRANWQALHHIESFMEQFGSHTP